MFKQGEKVGYVGRIMYRGDASAEFTPLEDLAGIGIELSLQRCNIEVARLNVSKSGSLFYTTLDHTRDLEGEYMLEVALVVRGNIVVAMQGAPLVIESSRLGSSLSRLITVEEVGAQESQLSDDQDALEAGIGEYRVELILTQKDAPLDEWDSEQGQSLLLKLGTIFKGDKGDNGDTPQIILNGELVEPQEDGAVDLGNLALGDDVLIEQSAISTAERLIHNVSAIHEVDGVLYFVGSDYHIYALSQSGLRDTGIVSKSTIFANCLTYWVNDDRLYILSTYNEVSIYDITSEGEVFVTSVSLTATTYSYFLLLDCSDGVYINPGSSLSYIYKLRYDTNELETVDVNLSNINFRIGSPEVLNYTYSGLWCYNKTTDTFSGYNADNVYISGLLSLSYVNYIVASVVGGAIRLYEYDSVVGSDGLITLGSNYYSSLGVTLSDIVYMRTIKTSNSLLLFTGATAVKLFEYDAANGVSVAPSEYSDYLDFTNYRVTRMNSLFSIVSK
ncbi:MAG: hypothetical protein SNH13_01695 [Rikenellaceae bacterium]